MSDPTGEPAPAERPGIWYRYRHAAMWIRIAIPVAALAILVGAGALIANAVSDDSSPIAGSTTTTAPGNNTILLLVATQLATDEASTTEPTTTIPPETIPPETTTVAPVPVDTTTPSTEPPPTSTAVTEPVTEPASTSPPTTPSPTSTTAKATTTTAEATTTTEAPTTTTEAPATTSTVVLPPGQIAASPQAFQEAWNKAAAGTGVASITTWTQEPIAGNTGNVADLGGNIRLVLLSDADATPSRPPSWRGCRSPILPRRLNRTRRSSTRSPCSRRR